MSTVNRYVRSVADHFAESLIVKKSHTEGKERQADGSSSAKPVNVAASLEGCCTREIEKVRHLSALLAVFTFFGGGLCYLLTNLPFVSPIGKALLVCPLSGGIAAWACHQVSRELDGMRLSIIDRKETGIRFEEFVALFRARVHNVRIYSLLIGFFLQQELAALPSYLEQAYVAKCQETEAPYWNSDTRIVRIWNWCARWLYKTSKSAQNVEDT